MMFRQGLKSFVFVAALLAVQTVAQAQYVVSGRVLEDVNGNGILDASDTNGVNGATIILTGGSLVPQVVFDVAGTGYYSFTNIPAGTYTINHFPPNLDWVYTSPSNGHLQVTLSGSDSTTNNFLDANPTTVGGWVRLDVNGNGAVDLEDTNSIVGATLELLDTNGVVKAVTLSTSATGQNYSFAGVLPGQYSIREIDPIGYHSSTQTGGGTNNLISVTVLSSTPNLTNNFYDTLPIGAIGGGSP